VHLPELTILNFGCCLKTVRPGLKFVPGAPTAPEGVGYWAALELDARGEALVLAVPSC